jgi:hypothetical protein
MKKGIYIFLLLFLITLKFSYAQCPGCVIDYSCVVSPEKPTLCPDTLPPGYAMQYYDEDVTFYMPSQFVDAGSGLNVTLNRIEVTGVVGMPFGLSFESSSPTNNFYPSSNPPTTDHGCAKFCGTPLIPGNYTITVFVKAYVTVLGMSQTQDDFFDIPITILPSPSGNSSFVMSNAYGCEPVVTDFTVLNPSGGNSDFSYQWNFGNGQTSNSETPPTQTYSTPGAYPVQLITTIDTLGYFLSAVSVSNVQCDDGIWGSPDPYIKIFEGTTKIYESAYVDNTYSASFNFPTISLANATYKIEVWDYDSGLLGGDDFCGQVFFNGHTAGNYALNASGMIVSFIVDHPVIQFNETDTVHVLPLPVVSSLTTLPGDTACAGDSILLQVVSNATIWQWYRDTLAMPGFVTPQIFVSQNGNYFVQLMNDVGCQTNSQIIPLVFMNLPPMPTFWQSGNTLQTMMSGYSLQWYFDGNPIPGENAQTLLVTQSGFYKLEARNSFQCASYSNDYYAQYTSIEDGSFVKEFTVFPNPTDDILNVRIESMYVDDFTIQILDMSGRVLMSEYVKAASGVNSYSFQLQDLSHGMYLIEVTTLNGSSTQRFVKR